MDSDGEAAIGRAAVRRTELACVIAGAIVVITGQIRLPFPAHRTGNEAA